jgi:hypothetical protein
MVNVEQLEQELAKAHGRWDGPLAKHISNLKLTERLSAAKLASLEKNLPGRQAREELMALADESAFLDLPPAEILSMPVPDHATQAALLARTANAAKKTVAQWPNFSAARVTTRFEGTATVIAAGLQDTVSSVYGRNWYRSPAAEDWECPGEPKEGYRRLSVIERTSVTVVYRGGQVVHTLGGKGGEFECSQGGVSNTDDFGEVLSWVPRFTGEGKVVWSHWEQGANGLLAVFRYAAGVSYKPQTCCVNSASFPATVVDVEGEIAVSSADGSVLRLTETRRWKEDRHGWFAAREYDTMVEYGSVEIGGTAYTCPVRRVAIFLTPLLRPRSWRKPGDAFYRRFGLTDSPLQEYLNDVSFGPYRLYGPGGQRRAGDRPEPDATVPASVSTAPPAGAPAKPPQY